MVVVGVGGAGHEDHEKGGERWVQANDARKGDATKEGGEVFKKAR
jgi:hypothetical protein